MHSIFNTVKSAVSVPAAAAFYGIPVNHSGMARCLFHRDRHPSMKLYPDHYFCFSCHAHGDVVSLAAEIFGLSPLEAAKRLSEDFAVRPGDGRELSTPPPRASEKTGIPIRLRLLSRYEQLLRQWMELYAPAFSETAHPHRRFVFACHELPWAEHMYDCLNAIDESDREWADKELDSHHFYKKMDFILAESAKEARLDGTGKQDPA